jgi:MerC mercury resistance protein
MCAAARVSTIACMEEPARITERLSKIGGWASIVCAVHCLAAPVILASIPLIRTRWKMVHTIEIVVILVAIVIGGTAVVSGYREHRRKSVLLLFAVAAALLLAELAGQEALVIAGAVLMAFTQFFNLHLERQAERAAAG